MFFNFCQRGSFPSDLFVDCRVSTKEGRRLSPAKKRKEKGKTLNIRTDQMKEFDVKTAVSSQAMRD